MTVPVPYLLFPGNASEALGFYADTFGGELTFITFDEFSHNDGPGDAIADAFTVG